MQNVTSINSKQMSNALCYSDFKTYLNTILSPQDRRAGIILLASTNENGIIALLREHFCFVHYIAGNRAIANITWTDEQICKNLDYIRWDEKAKEWDGIIANKVSSEPPKFPQYGKKVDPNLTEEQTKMPFSGKSCSFADPEKLNLCELLKNKIGIELYCTAYGYVKLTNVTCSYLTFIKYDKTSLALNSNGAMTNYKGECILFPSKDQRDWSKFNPYQFKDGERVWVKRYHSEVWNALYHSGTMTENNKHIVHECQKKNGKLIEVEDCRPFSEIPF